MGSAGSGGDLASDWIGKEGVDTGRASRSVLQITNGNLSALEASYLRSRGFAFGVVKIGATAVEIQREGERYRREFDSR